MHGGDNIPVHSGGDHNIFFVSPNAHTTVLSDSSAMASMVSHINSWASTVSGGSTPTPTPPTGGSGGSGGGTNPTPTPTPQPTPQPSDGVKVCHGANYGSPCTVFTDTGSAQSLGARSHDQDSVQFLGSYANAYDAVFCLRDGCPSNDSEIMHDDPDFSKRLVQNQYVAIKLVKLPPPQPTPNSGFVVYSDTNYGGNHGTFTYTNHDFCINLDQMAGHNKSVQYIGDYVGGYSAVMYHDTNCGTYLARYDDSKSDIGWGLYNQFSSMRLEKHVPPEKGVFQGSWNSPDDTATTQKGGIVHYSAHVTTTSGTLGRVEFRAVKDGTWHVSCIGTQSGNDYSCDWNPASAGYGDNSTFGIAFDVYDSLGNETSNLQPDRHITYAPTPPPTPAQGTWNSPQDNFTVVKGGTLHFSVTATGSAVAKLVIRGTWGTTPWTTLCSFSATTSHVYECDWNPGSSNVADNSSLRVAFDAYRADGWKILSSPAGDRVGMYAPPVQQPTPTPTPPAKDATQVSPANGSVLPIGTTETDVTYQGTGSFTIHVWDLTTHYDVWTAGIATTTYHLTGLQAGASYNWQILGSTATWTDTWTFSIAKAAPTPTPSPSPTPTPIPPQGTWNSPNDNFTVVKNGTLHFSANVTGSAVTKVNFRATWNSTPWVDDLCSLAVNNSHVYTCDWNIAARGVPDNTFVRTAFDAYDANGTKILSSPAGDRVGTYAPPTPTPSPTPPTVKSGGFTTIEGQTTTGTISATSVSGKKLTLTASNLPKFVTFKDNGNGTGIFTAKPVIGNAGNYSFTVTAGDGSLSGKGTVTIKVNSAPLPKPTVSWDMPMTMTATAGKAYTFKVKANPGKGDSIFIVDFFLQGGKYKILSACDQNKKDKNGDYSCSWNFKDYNGKKIAPGNYTIYAWVDTTKNQTVQSRLLKVTVR